MSPTGTLDAIRYAVPSAPGRRNAREGWFMAILLKGPTGETDMDCGAPAVCRRKGMEAIGSAFISTCRPAQSGRRLVLSWTPARLLVRERSRQRVAAKRASIPLAPRTPSV